MSRMLIIMVVFYVILSLAFGSVRAQTAGSAPLEITADQTLEWHRLQHQYIARGNAVARQGDVSIAANTLTADYRDGNGSDFEIYRMTAEQNVHLSSRGNNAYGDHAIYEVDSGLAVMTGNNLRLTSPDQVVTARDRFEYHINSGRLNAIGNVRVDRAEDRIEADSMTAIFAGPPGQAQQLDRLEAHGNVVITTPTEVLRGERGHYDAATNRAEISGNVSISRGPNVLTGARAEVDLTTNVSRMFGSGDGQTGRVRGVFYPGSERN